MSERWTYKQLLEAVDDGRYIPDDATFPERPVGVMRAVRKYLDAKYAFEAAEDDLRELVTDAIERKAPHPTQRPRRIEGG